MGRIERSQSARSRRPALRGTGSRSRCESHPALFPQAQTQPNIPDGEPLQEDVDRFRRGLRNAYRHGPRHRGSGPGGARNEHWSWMPALEDAWAPTEELMLRFALARLPARAMAALMSARVLAGDRSEDNKVRPFALGVIHRRNASKAVSRTFRARVAAQLAPVEYSIGSKGGAELMHKTVLADLDSRPDCVKLSFDASNAHNEYDREAALEAVREDVPDLLPWAKAALSVAAVHAHVGTDGSRTLLHKTRGGDQGDALTSLLLPLAYKRVSSAVEAAASIHDPSSRTSSYQDDLENICKPDAILPASKAYEVACGKMGLRANLCKTRATPGRDVNPSCLPQDLNIDPRAIVLRHGDGIAVPAVPAAAPANGSQLACGSSEVRALQELRSGFYTRLRKLRGAGLPAHAAMALMRTRVAGDHTFIARACGIPEPEAVAMDNELRHEIETMLGNGSGSEKICLRAADGGLGSRASSALGPRHTLLRGTCACRRSSSVSAFGGQRASCGEPLGRDMFTGGL